MKELKKKVSLLIKDDDLKALKELILDNGKEILKLLKHTCESTTKDGPHLIKSLLSALSSDSKDDKHLKRQIFEVVVTFLREREPNERDSGDLVTTLMVQAHNLSTEDLVALVESYVAFIKSGAPFKGRWTELFGRLLTISNKRENIIYNGNAIEGEDFIYKILKSLCDCKWNVETTITLLQILKELNLGKEELAEILNHLRRVLDDIDFQSIPMIVYHLVLLGQVSLPKEILKLILDYFKKQEERRENSLESETSSDLGSVFHEQEKLEHFEELTDAEGTSALHITHFSQYNSDLVKEHLKALKSSTWLPENLITPFNLILLLSLSSIDRYRDQIIDSLKSCILKTFKFIQNERKSVWLHKTFQQNFNLLKIFQKTIGNCKGGWLQVYEGLVHLCFSLLESGGGTKADTFPAKESVSLASKIIPMIIKKEHYLAPHVLKRLSCYIYTVSNPSQYIDLLGHFVNTCPLLLMDHLNLVQEILENLSFLTVGVATMLIHSLIPLLKMSMTLKDSLMIVLRKMLYKKEVESRQIAVQGFLLFLLHFKALGTLPSSQASTSYSSTFSQVSVDVHTAMDANTNEAFCFELIGILRRVLSQQHQVKSHLYAGLYDVIRNNPKLAGNVLVMLHGQLSLFLDLREDILNPVLFKKVVTLQGDSVIQIEPIGQLLSSITLCKTWYENSYLEDSEGMDKIEEREIKSILDSITTTFDSITDRLKDANLEDLGLNKDSFSQPDPSGKQALMHAEVIVNVYDALIEQSFCSGALQSIEKMRNLLALFKAQRKVIEATTAKPPPKQGKKGDAAKGKRKGPPSKNAVSFKSILDIRIASQMLKICLRAETDANENCAQLLQDNFELQIYLLNVANQEISGIKDVVPYQRKRFIPYLKTLGTLLLKECSQSLAAHEPDDTREGERMRVCLSTFSAIVTTSLKYFKERFPSIIKEFVSKPSAVEYNANLYSTYKKFQDILKRIIFHESSERFLRDAVILIQVIREITQQMEPGSKEIKKVQDWLGQLCKDQSIDSAPVCESLVSLLLSLTDQTHEKNGIPRGIAREMHCYFGDIEQNVSFEEEKKYKIVSDVSSTQILSCLLTYFESSLSVTEIALFKLKAMILSQHKGDEGIEKSLSIKFAIIIQALSEVLISALPKGTSVDSVIRIVTKLYSYLGLFVRYYLDLFRIKSSPKLAQEFEKMVDMSSTHIKSQILKLINYENDSQCQDKKRKVSVLAVRVQKESRLIPSLIFNLERYETLLVQLSKKSSVDLLLNAKLGTNRDFRIKVPVLEQIVQQDDAAEEDEESVDNNQEEEDSEDEAPPSKKRK